MEQVFNKYSENYLDDLCDIFSRLFSDEELKKLLEFWLSGPGQKLAGNDFFKAQMDYNLEWGQKIENHLINIKKRAK